jgi:AmmeMemoRadiSam system protein B
VVVIGPAHRVLFYGIATVSVEALETPLGLVSIDTALRDELVSKFDFVGYLDEAHELEHSLEVELPFIQAVVPRARVLPLLNGKVSVEQEAVLLDDLWRQKGVYFVISSDLSHYHSYRDAQYIDGETAQLIESGCWDALNSHRACGYKGIQGILQQAKRHPLEIVRLVLMNSGDTAGAKDQVVGYGAWAIWEAPRPRQ